MLRSAHDVRMREGVIGGIIGLVFGIAAVLSIGAMTDDGRDACAKAADLRAATRTDRDDLYLMFLDKGGEQLLMDCIND